jgi:hypothetical protein
MILIIGDRVVSPNSLVTPAASQQRAAPLNTHASSSSSTPAAAKPTRHAFGVFLTRATRTAGAPGIPWCGKATEGNAYA